VTRPIKTHYKQALSGFVSSGEEAGLELAYEIGRVALASGMSLSEVGELHYTARDDISGQTTDAASDRDRSELFFLEVSTVYDMALRGYRETIERLRIEVAERRKADAELRETAAELAHERDMLEQRVQERTRALQLQADQLQLSNLELERRNRELDDLAHIASHDLKEPLRAISNHANFLLEDFGHQLGEDGQHRLQRLIELSRRMTVLIGTLFRYSSLSRIEPAEELVDLSGMIAEIEAHLADMLQARNGRIVAAELPTVMGDRALISVVFQNLIGNAMKYNDAPEKRVRIGCVSPEAAADGFVTLYVSDNGIGIAPQFHDEIFRIFKRLNSEKAYGEGTGAGLSFVKKIVEHQGGRIWLESRPGSGTTFYLTLPAAPPASAFTIAKG
jgi:light-regulated signal transduction histidine kinase (bacteriophytochrome)